MIERFTAAPTREIFAIEQRGETRRRLVQCASVRRETNHGSEQQCANEILKTMDDGGVHGGDLVDSVYKASGQRRKRYAQGTTRAIA